MNNTDIVLDLIRRSPGLTDTEIREQTGIKPHQQINRICHRLEQLDFIRRVPGSHGLIVNLPAAASRTASLERPPSTRLMVPRPPTERPARAGRVDKRSPSTTGAAQALARIDPSRTLLVLACSGCKERGNRTDSGSSIAERLPPDLADQLAVARQRVASKVRLDESTLLPAWRRYNGRFYKAASRALAEGVGTAAHILIISGGYGVVLATESIGTYNAIFNSSWWPARLIERCLAEYARRYNLSAMVAFVASTTEYARVVRRAQWRPAGVDHALIVSPSIKARGGAQVFVPRAAGEAFAAFWSGSLRVDWSSSDGLGLTVSRVS